MSSDTRGGRGQGFRGQPDRAKGGRGGLSRGRGDRSRGDYGRGDRGRGRGRGRDENARFDTDGQYNEHLNERIGRPTTRQNKPQDNQLPVVLNQRIGQYLRKKVIASGPPDWTVRSEIPSIEELLPYDSFQPIFDPSRSARRLDVWKSHNKEPHPNEVPSIEPPSSALGWDDSPELTTWKPLESEPLKRDASHEAETNDASHSTTHDWDDTGKGADAWDDTANGDDVWDQNVPQDNTWQSGAQEPAADVDKAHPASQEDAKNIDAPSVNEPTKGDKANSSNNASWDDTEKVHDDWGHGTAQNFASNGSDRAAWDDSQQNKDAWVDNPAEICIPNDASPSGNKAPDATWGENNYDMSNPTNGATDASWDETAQTGKDDPELQHLELVKKKAKAKFNEAKRAKKREKKEQQRLEEANQTDYWNPDCHVAAAKPSAARTEGAEQLPSWDDTLTGKDAWDVEANVPESGDLATGTGDIPVSEMDWDIPPPPEKWVDKGWESEQANNTWFDSAPEKGTNGRTHAKQQDDNLAEQVDEGFENVLNKIEGPWGSKAEYLRNHYLLLREDSLRDLRSKLKYFRENPELREDPSTQGLGIYDEVHVCGITFSNRGLGVRVSFSLGRVGKRVRWEQSPRLKTGTLVVLMTRDNAICKVAIVAARTLENLSKDPPEIDLFLSRGEDMDLDCSQEWIMLEERSAYFEAQRHTMTALQRMMREDFPLQEYLVKVQPTVDTPEYLYRNPERDLSDLFRKPVPRVNLLEEWPENSTSLDESQVGALKRILTKKLALVQGPPGTGKTYVSTQALKVLLANMGAGDPPIVVTCQTNHALDQLLRHVAEFEPAFARLGGRSQDKDIMKRTVFELKGAQKSHSFREYKAFEALKQEIAEMISPLIKSPPEAFETLDMHQLEELNILSSAQVQSLKDGAAKWKTHETNPSKNDPMIMWVGERNLERSQVRRLPFLAGWETEDADLDVEEVAEADAENLAREEEDEIERLKGDFYMIGDTWIGRCFDAKAAMMRAEATLKATRDLYKIKSGERGAIYRYLQQALKNKIKERLIQLWPKYEAMVEARRIWTYEGHEIVLRDQKVIGMTTTGLSKYRGLIAAIGPKVVLIEEAAETMEGPVIAGCVESLEHLILVGDHKQLRPHCNVMDLERAPYHLNISLFERMVDNGVEFSLLKRQRRMKPEIRRMLLPIYGEKIKDHKKVHEQAMVPGMGGLTAWFFTHESGEMRDDDFSVFNPDEADMVFGLVQYLGYNGMKDHEITILTFYRAQVACLKRLLRNYRPGVKVVTVDSYQGEENEVVILSLVRSNMEGRIGFVANENRICVALSRAKRGFYLFGNAECLVGESRIWTKLITDLKNGSVGKTIHENAPAKDINKYLPNRRIGFVLPLWCPKHQRMTFISQHQDWASNVGGCQLSCRGTLNCGHRCLERCHPWDHESYNNCQEPCKETMPCGHKCSLPCKDIPHVCKACATKEQLAQLEAISRKPDVSYNSVAEAENSNPESESLAFTNDGRMGRLLEGDFKGLNYGGDGYTYDSKNRPVVQGQRSDRGDPVPQPPRSSGEHYNEVYRADVHAQETAKAKSPPPLPRVKMAFHQNEPRRDLSERGSRTGNVEGKRSVSIASGSKRGSESGIAPSVSTVAAEEPIEDTVQTIAEEVDLLGDEGPAPLPPSRPQPWLEQSLLDLDD